MKAFGGAEAIHDVNGPSSRPVQPLRAGLDVHRMEAVAWLQRIYEEHAEAVRRTLLRLGTGLPHVDDLVQDVFVVAFRRQATFDRSRAPRPWLLGIAVRVAASHRRRERLRAFFTLDEAADSPSLQTPERVMEQNDARRKVDAALAKLDRRKREVLVLYELEGLTGEEISSALQCPLKTVWTRLARARAEFHAHLQRAELLQRRRDGA
jgi:RNA polymerase sigma-70 factor, ECF subfamily